MTAVSPASFIDRVFAVALWILPTRAISRFAHTACETRIVWLKRALIRGFLRAYPAIDLREAREPDPEAYPSFNAFFTRALAVGTRPLPGDRERIVAPVDGQMGAFGTVDAGTMTQTKGVAYDLRTLVGGDEALAATFAGGRYATFYLAPQNYHRVHMPLDGCIRETRYLPGRLFGVNPRFVRAVPRLFARNERLLCCFDTAAGPVALIMIGAFIVGSIHTRWDGRVCPPHRRVAARRRFIDTPLSRRYYARGAEMGHFAMGSSVILLFTADAIAWEPGLAAGQSLRLGEPVGRLARAVENTPR